MSGPIDRIVAANEALWRLLNGGGIQALNELFPPKVGDRFEHARVLNADLHTPMVYRVTRIANGTIYYRPVDGGAPQCCDLASFHRYVKRFV